MNILVLNGSPKGENSITLQSVLYLQKTHPEHAFHILHAGSTVRRLEKDLTPVLEGIRQADVILFSYPVYTFIVPSQLHRLIELVKQSGVRLEEKYVSQITTSKHFYDITAHRFIRDNCQDLGALVVNGLSADMEDLLTEKGRKELSAFFSYLEWCVRNGISEPLPEPLPSPAHRPVTPAQSAGRKQGLVAVVADLAPEDHQLSAMIDRFRAKLPYETRFVNIHDFAFRGGCLGCFGCASDGQCVYRDGFQQMLRGEIQTCDAIVIAFTIRDHSMGSVFKTYDDRQFCNGHRTVTMGKPFGYLISGSYSREDNLRMIIDGRAEVGGNFLAGTATDESDPDREIDALCARLDYALENRYTQPMNFLGVGGSKIFRDLIWLMRGMMKADHRFFKEHGQYDFPQKQRATVLKMKLVGALISSPKLKSRIGSRMTEGMLAPYKKALDSVEKK